VLKTVVLLNIFVETDTNKFLGNLWI